MISLKPLSEGKNLGNFGVFDIEAHDWTKFLIAGFYNGETYLEYYSPRQFIKDIFTRAEFDNINTIFAHFGGKYDFLFIINQLIRMEGYIIENCIPRGSSLLCFDLVHKGKRVSFKDTSAFLPFSLENITKTFGVEHKKKKFDFDRFNRLKKKSREYMKMFKELKIYLKFDCVGLHESIRKYCQNPLIQQAGFASTTASQSLRIFRTYLNEPISGIYGNADEYIRKGYFGGRVEIFKPLFDGPGLINSYDYNSLYPSILADPKNDFPGGVEGITDKLDFDSLGFFWCKVFVPEQYMPPLPYLHKGKLLFPCGYLEGVWSVAELKNAVEKYGVKIIRVKSGYKLRNIGNPFSDFIHEIYARRLEAKKQGDSVTDIICKLTMNSLYGRFGLRKDRENFAFDENQKEFAGKWNIHVFEKVIRLGTIPVELSASFSNIGIAAYTTSYARILNLNNAAPWAQKDLFYTDTDCYIRTGQMPENRELGGLKKEYSADQACFLLPKTYIIKSRSDSFEIVLENGVSKTNKKIVMKGFNSRKVWREFDLAHFKTALEGDLSMLKINNEPKFATFKRALQKKKILTMLDAESRKINSKYSKRRIYKAINGNYDTEPLIITSTGEIKNGNTKY